MKIHSITIENFRSIKKAKILLHNITAIVGENNAGKTAILRAINAVMNFEEEKEQFFSGRHRYAPRCNTKITVEFDDIPDIYSENAENGILILRLKYNYNSNKKNFYIVKNNVETSIEESFVKCLSNYIVYVYIPTERTYKDILWKDNSIFQRLVSSYIAQHTENRDRISTPVRNVSRHIHDIALKKLEKEINQLYMQNKDVDFQINFPDNVDYSILLNNIVFSLNEFGKNYELQEWGSGTRSLAVIAMHRAYALLNRANIVLGIEEPEVNLHPQAQKRLIMSLREKRHQNETQAIFTTHSTVLIDELSHTDIILVRRTKDDKRGFVSDINQLHENFWDDNNITEFKHNQFFHYKNSDFFFSKFIIICESKNDCQVFEHLLNPKLKNKSADVSYIDAGGVENISYPYFLLKELKIPFTIVVDKDYFFKYQNDKVDDSRDMRSGLPIYSQRMNHNLVLDDLFNQIERNEIESANRKGYREFFGKIKTKNIVSMNFCLEMDLTCSSQARELLYDKLNILAIRRSQLELLTKNKNSIKKIENISFVLKNIPTSKLPESYNKIKNFLLEQADRYLE